MALRPSKSLEPQSARDAALRLLGRREHSARELTEKLQSRGLDDKLAEQVVESLGSTGWQSDARYAEQLVRSRVAQGYGPVRIGAELGTAGICEIAAREALAAAAIDWDVLARRVWARKFGGTASSIAEGQKQYRFLAGRGFTGEQIRRALQAAPDPDDL